MSLVIGGAAILDFCCVSESEVEEGAAGFVKSFSLKATLSSSVFFASNSSCVMAPISRSSLSSLSSSYTVNSYL